MGAGSGDVGGFSGYGIRRLPTSQPPPSQGLETIVTPVPDDLAHTRDAALGTACILGGFTIAGSGTYLGATIASETDDWRIKLVGGAIVLGSLAAALGLRTLSCYFYTPPSKRETWKQQEPHAWYVGLARYFS